LAKNTDVNRSIIHQLPPEVSNKIAAGEVIQRPNSVIKELLDNAIDAGADQIKIIVQNAGRTLMQVIDNGCGMGRQDIRLCFEQHATSKIKNVDELFNVRTLGFRGEAMPSIASVSQITLKSKRPGDDAGFEYEIWGGEEKKFEPAGVDDGTSVAVRNLFYNVPARRQFLKTDATEFRHILKTVQQSAIANADIGFHLEADGDKIYDLPANQPLEQRISAIFGKDYRASLIPFREETSYVNISGLLIDPKLTKRSRGEQFLFVNGRPFQHRYIIHTILNVYETWIGERDYPFFALFIEADPAEIDVNVHPAKEEVKFEDERSVVKLVRSVVKKTLNEKFGVPEVPEHDSFTGGRKNNSFSSGLSFGGESSAKKKFSSRINLSPPNRKQNLSSYGETLYSAPDEQNNEENRQEDESITNRNFWQLHNCYILTQTRSGMCIIDQNAAHKRIIYERSLKAAESGLPSTQQLLFAQSIELSATEYSLLKELQGQIQRMGFNIELLSGNTVLMSGVPADTDIGDEQSVLKMMLQKYRELENKIELDERHRLAAAFASKTAVPKGEKLTDAEMENLIDQLFSCDEPYSDPLKKSTIVYIPLEDVEAKFG